MVEVLEALTPEDKQRLQASLETRNGMVVEFNRTLTVCFQCNTCISHLGSAAAAKVAFFYTTKYTTKGVTPLAASLVLYRKAYQHVHRFPSVADDTGTPIRTFQHFIANCLNRLQGAVEMPSAMAASALLGFPAEYCTHSTINVYAKGLLSCAERLNPERQQDAAAQPVVGGQARLFAVYTTAFSFCSCEHIRLCPQAPDMVDVLEPDAQQADLVHDLMDAIAPVGTGFGTAGVFHVQQGEQQENIVVPPELHYVFRGAFLLDVAPWEYYSLVSVSARPESLPVGSGAANHDPALRGQQRGRWPNAVFEFAPAHPLYTSHVQKLRSLLPLPAPVGRCPVLNVDSTDAQKAAAARYLVALFEPWTTLTDDGGTRPGGHYYNDPWQALVDLCERLRDGTDPTGPARLAVMDQVASGLRLKTVTRMVCSAHRARAATRWNRRDPAANVDDDMRGAPPDEQADHALAQELVVAIERARAAGLDPFATSGTSDFANRVGQLVQELYVAAGVNNSLAQQQAQAGPPLQTMAAGDVAQMLDALREAPQDAQPAASQEGEPAAAPDADEAIVLCDEQQRALHSLLNKPVGQQALVVIHGGPGVGKTAWTNELLDQLDQRGIRTACTATTGSAASHLKRGRTLHSALGFNPLGDNSDVSDDISATTLAALQRELQDVALILIDEASMLPAGMLHRVDQRCRSIWPEHNRQPFAGRDVVLVGDFFQLEPVKAKALFTAVVLQRDNPAKLNPTETAGAMLFEGFRLTNFVQQHRAAADPEHGQRILDMRASDNPVTEALVGFLRDQTLTANALAADPQLAEAPIVVSTNAERDVLNLVQARAFAQRRGTKVLTWVLPISTGRNHQSSAEPAAERPADLARTPGIYGVFVEGAPAYLTRNLQPLRGLANGTAVTYESLIFATDEDRFEAQRAIDREPGDVVLLPVAPTHVLVRVRLQPHAIVGLDETLLQPDGTILVPIGYRNDWTKVSGTRGIKVRNLMVELGFAITFFKIQGRTVHRLILNLNRPPRGSGINFHSLYVGLSRVRYGTHIFILPPLEQRASASDPLRYLLALKPRPNLRRWLGAFQPDGTWNPAALPALPAAVPGQAARRARPVPTPAPRPQPPSQQAPRRAQHARAPRAAVMEQPPPPHLRPEWVPQALWNSITQTFSWAYVPLFGAVELKARENDPAPVADLHPSVKAQIALLRVYIDLHPEFAQLDGIPNGQGRFDVLVHVLHETRSQDLVDFPNDDYKHEFPWINGRKYIDADQQTMIADAYKASADAQVYMEALDYAFSWLGRRAYPPQRARVPP